MLSERKKKILQAVINENIKSAEPISSNDLQKKYFNAVSSATIRNELMGLEEMGYLTHPHTSSGRVPTAIGFKKYIEELMPEERLSIDELKQVQSNFSEKINGIEELAVVAAKTISEATKYASIVYMGISEDAVVENIKLVKITDEVVLAIIVTDMGIIKDITIEVPKEIGDEECLSAEKILSDSIKGTSLGDIKANKLASDIIESLDKYRVFFDLLVEAIKERDDKKFVKVDGTANLLSQPEYRSIDKAQKAMTFFENKNLLSPLVETGNDLEISISVGADEEQDCSVVSARYKINGKEIGRAGVVGPVRMNYAKAVSVLKEINQTIENSVSLTPGHKNQEHKPANKKDNKNWRHK